MTNPTGSNNLEGLLGGLLDAVDTMVVFAERKLSDLLDGEETDDDESARRVTYKLVAELGLADTLVLDDGDWDVKGVQGDGFDPDIVTVTLGNGESYDLLRTSLVRVA